MELDYKSIGKRITLARKSKHITQCELAEMVNISSSHISNIETGKKPLSLSTLVNICNALEITADALLLDNYVKNDELLQQELLAQMQCKSVQQLDLTMKIAEVVKTWWTDNQIDENK